MVQHKMLVHWILGCCIRRTEGVHRGNGVGVVALLGLGYGRCGVERRDGVRRD